MDQAQLTKLALAGAVLFAAFKFGGQYGKAGAIAVASVIAAKNVPYVKDVV